MIDTAISWLTSNPLPAVAGLAAAAICISLVLLRHFHDLARHEPPRC